MHIASHFTAHPKIECVLYPGLADHLGHEISKRQMQGGYGGMMPIQVAGGRALAERARQQHLGLVGRGRDQVAGLAAVADEDVRGPLAAGARL